MLNTKQKSIAKVLAMTTIFFAPFYAMADDDHDKDYYKNNAAFVKVEVGTFFKSNAEIEIKMSNKSAYGFEGQPQTSEEEKQRNNVGDYLRNNISDIVAFDKDLACTYQVKKMEQKRNKIEAEYKVKCKDDLRGRKITFDFSKPFKNVQSIYLKLEGKEEIRTSLPQNTGTVILK